MNINETLVMKEKTLRKIKGCTYKMKNVSPTLCSSLSNVMPIQCLDIVLVPLGII